MKINLYKIAFKIIKHDDDFTFKLNRFLIKNLKNTTILSFDRKFKILKKIKQKNIYDEQYFNYYSIRWQRNSHEIKPAEGYA